MKILFCSELFWPFVGGIERLGAKLVSDLQKRGQEVTVITSHGDQYLPDEDSLDGVAVIRYPFRRTLKDGHPAKFMKERRKVESRIRSLNPDIVHMYSVGAGLFFLRDTLRNAGVPLVVTLHNETLLLQGSGRSSILAETLRTATWVTGCSAAVLNEARKLVPEICDRSCVIRNSFELGAFNPTPVPTKPMRLLCLGRLIPEKGFDTAISTLNAVHERFPGVRLEIAGDGPERKSLEQLVASLGLENSVEFLGPVPPEQVPHVIDRASIVLMPSHTEGLPVAAIEAALVGRPIVATGVGGIPEIVRDEVTGLLTRPGSLAEFIKATATLLAAPKRIVEMGLSARQYANAQFSWPRYRDAHVELYEGLTKDLERDHSAA